MILAKYSFGIRLLIFLVINFGVLAVGGYFQGEGSSGDWYQNLNKAPWTPPGWIFGVSWTTIMLLLSFFMANASVVSIKFLYPLFIFQLILNISWNPVFFIAKQPLIALIIITSLTVVVFVLMIISYDKLNSKSYLLIPYFIWLCVATSLNLFVLLNN